MTITLEPIRIKETLYLRIPKDIADMTDIQENTKFSLKITMNGTRHILEYQIE